uniref:Myb-like domain-containing protein n=1 Tax=Kalanchoe fedtschenkoi TaxID=63787 RepID=A0A7N1A348_KALFE
MEGRHHHHQHHHLAPQLAGTAGPSATTSMEAAASGDSRFPQWSMQETKEFLMIRAELDRTFMETKRNKLLWEVISTKMREKGFNRSADQCKCKWKNLVTRYKGCETMEPDGMSRQQFPFYSDMQGIFTARLERALWSEAQGGAAAAGSSGLARKRALSSSDEDEESDEGDQRTTAMTPTSSNVRKKKKGKVANARSGGVGELREILGEFMKQQMQMEAQWREAFEAREAERRAREVEWIRNMEALESERLSMERRWRERQEQRMLREEARAEKRDALITCLLNKLRREESSSASHHHQLPPPP